MNKKSNIATRGMKLGAVSLGALMIAAPNLVMAQDAPTAPAGETVVVTGLRGSLAKSIRTKRNEASIVEVVSAEEIGKLPDASIAESLARLPGITGQRVGGDVQQINIRGTSPDFTVTTLNGRLQGSRSDGRGVEVDQYPSELVNGVVVYKTPDSSVAGQGLSGTVDMRSIRPLSVNKRTISINLRGETTSLNQLNPDVPKNGWRGSASYVNQFMDGKLGVALGIAHLESTRQTQYQEIWGYDGNTGASATASDAGIPAGQTSRALSSRLKRDGIMGVFEYKPNDNSHTTVDLYYTKYKQDEVMRGIENSLVWAGESKNRLTTMPFGGTTMTDTATYTNVQPMENSQLHASDDSIFSFGLNHEFKSGNTDFVADVSYSKAESDQTNIEMYSSLGANRTQGVTVGLDWNGDDFSKFVPGLSYGDANTMYLGENAPWGGYQHDGFLIQPHVEDSYAALDFKAKTHLKDSAVGGFIDSIDYGVNFSNHDKLKSATDNDLCLKSFVQVAAGTETQQASPNCGFASVPNTYRRMATPIGTRSIGNADLSFAGWGPVVAFDIRKAVNDLYNINPRNDNGAWGRNWTLNEQVFTAFTRANFDHDVFGHVVKGNLGVQLIDTKTESTGYMIVNATTAGAEVPQLRTLSNHYTDVLPSLNMSVDVVKNLKLRVGIAKQMARPRPDELSASFLTSLSQINSPATVVINNVTVANPDLGKWRYSGSGGNPLLEPWRAKSYDTSLEWYLKPKSYLAIAGFYKVFDSFIYTQNVVMDFANVPNPLGRPLVSTLGTFSQPVNGVAAANGKDAYIKGIELSGSLDFGEFIPLLDGFGFTGSYTSLKNNIMSSNNSTAALPGFSGISHNTTLFYEKHGFQARVSHRWRQGYRSAVAGFFSDVNYKNVLADDQLDAQIGYTFSEGKLNGLSVLLQAINTSDSPWQTQSNLLPDGTYLPAFAQRYGSKYLFGVTYKF